MATSIESIYVDDDSFPMIGSSISMLLSFVEDNGGAAAFEGMTTDDVKNRFVLPATAETQQSICQQLHAAGDNRIGRPSWFVSHAWKYTFLQLLQVKWFSSSTNQSPTSYRTPFPPPPSTPAGTVQLFPSRARRFRYHRVARPHIHQPARHI